MSWRVWIDTGGTFTDCIALGSDGQVRRVKVLSSGVIRRRVVGDIAGGLAIESEPSLPAGFLTGLTVQPQARHRPPIRVDSHEITADGGVTIGFSDGVSASASPGEVLEFSSEQEAPVLGLHLLFDRCLGDELPAFELRLGTTRGTNALLEGTGARTAAFLTRGFGDLLHIGDQSRPDIFSLRIEKPSVLADPIHEVAARRDRSGEIVAPLEGPELRRIARCARDLLEDGVEAVAVSLLHSIENDEDERRVVEALKTAGFEHVSGGASRSRLRGYLHRTQTAVVDATLAPIMKRYLGNVRRGVGRSFQVMSSAGGLVHVDRFRAKDALLSGPAGGVIGCRHAAAQAGLLPALGFDMGGTSTDVSRVDDALEYDARHDVGGQVVHAAALAIRTVAAGGGSICRVEHDEALVGPQSAGAEPGPACYGAGGPLTLTDVNLLLGRIDPDRFEVPLDLGAAERACAEQLEQTANLERSELLEGFLRVANERMADTIRQVSTRRGFDPRDHALVAFGGAGGQHACAVAELLGIRRVLVPEDCSLLSAVGIGVAQPEWIAHEQISCRVDDSDLDATLRRGEETARHRLLEREQLGSGARLRSETVVQMRYVGQDEGLEVDWGAGRDLSDSFEAAYEALFGYRVARPIEVDWARFRVQLDDEAPRLRAGAHHSPEVRGRDGGSGSPINAWFDGASQLVDRVDRGSVPVGEEKALRGPLLVSEPFSSTWLPTGWSAFTEPVAGGLVLTRLHEWLSGREVAVETER